MVSPALEDDFISDIRGKNILHLLKNLQTASDKHLCICIRYFSEKVNSVMTAFAGLVPVVEAMGEALLYAMFKTLTPASMPQQFPKGGTTFLFQLQDDSKKDDWRADVYRWQQSGTKKIKCGANIMRNTFFQVRPSLIHFHQQCFMCCM